jgi:nuclear polyadenylated RNA-binding protein 3
MTPDAPEFQVTKTLSPLSPLPLHPPEPSNIPVLRNQIDPVLNMTSTFDPPPALSASTNAPPEPNPNRNIDSPSDDSNFSDAYNQADGKDGNGAETVKQGTVVSDDYAMTFDSDEEAHSDSQDNSLPFISAPQPPSSLSHVAHDANLPPQDAQQPTVPDIKSSAIPATDNVNPSETSPDQSQADGTTLQTHTYESIASGEIDIQQLLDNITANAEKNAAASTPTTPSSATATSFPKTSGLPLHSSLPPRPQVPAKRFHDDISKYHAGLPQTPYNRPLGTNLVASGAPGTSTDPRGGLPPPPTASFPVPQSAGSPMSPGSYGNPNTQDQKYPSHEVDDADSRWGPEIQKKYDDFISQERVYVTEGLWDRFPPNSRLFIGEHIARRLKVNLANLANRQPPVRESDEARHLPYLPQVRQDWSDFNQTSLRFCPIRNCRCLLCSS